MKLRVSGVSVTYPARSGSTAALSDVSLECTGGEVVCLVGPSGCGKSTLLKVIAGLLEPTAGSVDLALERDPLRLERALVFQDHCVFPWMTVLGNVAFGLEFAGLKRPERHARARTYIEQVGLSGFADGYPHELSVGMRQRVALARAFVANPHVLLMDEPFASLDALTKLVLQAELLRMWTAERPLIVYVTHDLAEAVVLGDRVVVMSDRPGRILADVPIPLERPRNLQDRGRSEVVEIERRLWSVLEGEVRRAVERTGT